MTIFDTKQEFTNGYTQVQTAWLEDTTMQAYKEFNIVISFRLHLGEYNTSVYTPRCVKQKLFRIEIFPQTCTNFLKFRISVQK